MVLIHNPRCRSNFIYHSWDCCKLGCWERKCALLSFQVNRLNWIKNRDIIPDVAGGAVGVISLTSSSMVESSTVSTSATLVMASYDGGSLGFWNLKHNAWNCSSDTYGFGYGFLAIQILLSHLSGSRGLSWVLGSDTVVILTSWPPFSSLVGAGSTSGLWLAVLSSVSFSFDELMSVKTVVSAKTVLACTYKNIT